MRARLLPLLPLLSLGALPACDDAAAPGTGGLTADEVTALSDAMVDADFDLTGTVALAGLEAELDPQVSADPVTATTEFTVSRPCPVDGQVVVEGVHVRVWDRETHTGTSDLSLVKTHEACARTVGTVTITVQGQPNVALEAHHAWADGRRDGLQTLTMKGGIGWSTDDGREGACAIDVSATFDPEAHTRTVTGTFCNRVFERTTTWTGMGSPGGGMGA